jgi:ubiquinone/menaquinone biosynthesis C-methylase UbiE
MFPNLKQRFFSPDHPELMDEPNLEPAELDQDLRNLETINRYFGGQNATQFIIKKIKQQDKGIRTLLDCASGAGDLTQLLSMLLPQTKITGVDFHLQTLAYAEKNNRSGKILWQQADIKKLPYADKSFDVVTCQLALHHFSESDAIQILVELKRVSKSHVFITDLIRSGPGYFGIWLLVHSWLRHPMTRHDALLSARRAFSSSELKDMARRANWVRFNYSHLPWFRQAIWF